jgi:hypothetical protein
MSPGVHFYLSPDRSYGDGSCESRRPPCSSQTLLNALSRQPINCRSEHTEQNARNGKRRSNFLRRNRQPSKLGIEFLNSGDIATSDLFTICRIAAAYDSVAPALRCSRI